MTTIPYLRDVQVVVESAALPGTALAQRTDIQNLYIKFNLRWEASATPAAGDIEIYNLSDATESRIRRRGDRVTLLAGYQGNLEEIAQGDVRRVERKRSGTDRITVIRFGGSVQKQNAAVFSRTYQGPAPLRNVVQALIASMGLHHGDLSAIPLLATIEGRTLSGQSSVLLERYLGSIGLTYYEERGVIHIRSRAAARAAEAAAGRGIIISEATGMVGTPTLTDDGIRVRTRLNHRIMIDTLFRVEALSLVEAADTDYTVVSYEHSGDNRGGGWYTDIEGRPA